MSDPARAISKDDAFAELESLATDGLILFEGAASPSMVSFEGHDPSTGNLMPGNVAGVIIRNGNHNNTPNAPDRLDPRNALAIVRFCQFLSNNFGVTDMVHFGLDGGGFNADGSPRTDCHGQGRACDFAGVTMPVGGVMRTITVTKHWGTVATSATPGGSWPPGAGGNVHYRLDEVDAQPLGDDPDGNMFIADFFRSVYGFIATEWQDTSDGADPAGVTTTIGDSSFIMHPDHPASHPLPAKNGREAHFNHIHMQIGRTGTE
ncbi:hypothetical protein [Nocardia sp. NBC_00403]|uniref:hypothetical protein n=1 Tax=Nocardia sp. NBC_00403 TaxID=2975990 RepID=UPI002E21A78A